MRGVLMLGLALLLAAPARADDRRPMKPEQRMRALEGQVAELRQALAALHDELRQERALRKAAAVPAQQALKEVGELRAWAWQLKGWLDDQPTAAQNKPVRFNGPSCGPGGCPR